MTAQNAQQGLRTAAQLCAHGSGAETIRTVAAGAFPSIHGAHRRAAEAEAWRLTVEERCSLPEVALILGVPEPVAMSLLCQGAA